MILYIKHISIEGPVIIGEYFDSKGYSSKIIDLSQGDAMHSGTEDVEAVIVLGGPMNVYEEEKYPYLKNENVFIQRILNDDIPFLGICLGSQLLAKAVGASVKKAKEEEIGFYKVELTSSGQKDALFKNVKDTFDVFQWHGDTFDVPEAGNLLVKSDICRNQAFRVGKRAYGLQFHVEVDGNTITDWSRDYWDNADDALRERGEGLLRRYDQIKDHFEETGKTICSNFENIIKDHKRSVQK